MSIDQESESNEVLPGQEDIFSFLQSKHEPELPWPENTVDCAQKIDQESDDCFLQMKDGQLSFVDPDEWWKEHWVGMPEFAQDNTEPWKTIYIHLRCREDMKELETLLSQRLSEKTKSVWYPAHERVNRICMAYIDEA